MQKLLSGILAIIISALSAIGIPINKGGTETSERIAEIPAFEVNGRYEARVKFKSARVNTVEIRFSQAAPAAVTVRNEGEEIYFRSSNDEYRFCAFKTVETDELSLVIEGNASVESAVVSLKNSGNSDFRITSYIVASAVLDPSSLNKDAFDVVTDAVLFGCAGFDEKGELKIDAPVFERALENVRAAIGKRRVAVHLNLLGPGPDPGIDDWTERTHNAADKHTAAFKNKNLVKEIAGALEKYDLDGVFFDYEFPLRRKDWNAFNRFILRLDRVTDGKIGLAVAVWNMAASPAVKKAVDTIEIMQYDLFDDEGNHSSFKTATDGFESVKKKLVPIKKTDLGLPFYGRPADGGARWFNYRDYASELARFDYVETERGKIYFNNVQTIYDKIAYALDVGFGGAMVWHYSCDAPDPNDPLSLFGAAGRCIKDRII